MVASLEDLAELMDIPDAVIGVTRGCMKLLSRDELQGVIAHEFSHILNGDMKLNMRQVRKNQNGSIAQVKAEGELGRRIRDMGFKEVSVQQGVHRADSRLLSQATVPIAPP